MSASISFAQLQPGDKARVLGFQLGSQMGPQGASGQEGYSQKLRSLGLMPGTHFEVMRVAPLGDPLEIKVRGFNLSVRRQEAAHMLVEKLSP